MPTTYDKVRYIGSAFAQTHPIRLATIGALFGMQPAPVDRCRVLEIGCGDGGNLIPMALEYPDARFVGIDLAESAVASGNDLINLLGLRNISLRAMNLLDVTPALGQFDYIIAHGVFAWVPRIVQDKLLAVASENLAPEGIAYVSYNAYPGAHLRLVVREMMHYFLGDPSAHSDPVGDSVPFLKFIAENFAGDEHRGVTIADEIKDTLERTPWVVYHDELAEAYTPVYFHEFIHRAAACGLQFLSEAQFQDLDQGRFKPEIAAVLDRLCGTDRLRREQFWDFLRLRKFRSTLLVHSSVALDSNAASGRIQQMYVSSRAEVLPPESPDSDEVEFRAQFGANLKTAHPAVKAAISTLIQRWPESVPFEAVLHEVERQTAAPFPPQELANILLAGLEAGLLYVEAFPVHCVRHPGERPNVRVLARIQAEHGAVLTTQRHTSVDPGGDVERFLVTLLDGTRDRRELLTQMKESIETDAPLEIFAQMLDENLDKLARMALLTG